METREFVIVQEADKLFRERGFKRVTMDDIAGQLGMSKKTLYKYFDNKRDLILSIMKYHIEDRKTQLCTMEGQAKDAIGQMVELIHHVSRMFEQVHPDTFDELKRFYPRSWKLMDEFMQQHVYERIVQNIEWGRKEGLYRVNVESDILARLYVAKVRSIFEGKLFPVDRYEKKKLLEILIEYHIRGIASEKGRNTFEMYQRPNPGVNKF